MITHEIQLDMVPNTGREEVWLNQYDDDFLLRIHLYASRGAFTVASGASAQMRGSRPDGGSFSVNGTISQEDDETWMVEVAGDQQMTAASGRAIAEITLSTGGKLLSTANFVLNIERAAFDRGAPDD